MSCAANRYKIVELRIPLDVARVVSCKRTRNYDDVQSRSFCEDWNNLQIIHNRHSIFPNLTRLNVDLLPIPTKNSARAVFILLLSKFFFMDKILLRQKNAHNLAYF